VSTNQSVNLSAALLLPKPVPPRCLVRNQQVLTRRGAREKSRHGHLALRARRHDEDGCLYARTASKARPNRRTLVIDMDSLGAGAATAIARLTVLLIRLFVLLRQTAN